MLQTRIILPLLILILYIQDVSAYCPPFLRNQTACTCTDYSDGAIIKCSGPQGPLVVEELKKAQIDVRELALENAHIVEIGSRAFKNLRIKKLVLDNNRIVSIQRDAFRGLESVLQELSINHNRLPEVPTEALQGLRALNVLSLRCNEIGNLTESAFQSLPSLIEINLACNKICKVDDKALNEVKETLQNLILDNNCLRYIPTQAVEGMQFLIALHIKYNKIEKLGKNDLRNLTSLSMLTLTGNNISHISKKFVDNTPSLRYIYLAENALSSIDPGTMKQFLQAEIIDLSYNNLPEINVDMFSGMENLQHLNLEANAIKDIAPGAFATTPLLLLWLPHNCLTSVSPNMFQGTPFLKQVSLAHNNIRNIQPFSFAHLANLHTLDLANNKIQTLQQSAIMGSDYLTVRVQENPQVCSQDGFHVMNGREAINLTTEANLICQTDYAHDVVDKCPRRLDRPARPPCCRGAISNTKKVKTTTLPPTTVSESTTEAFTRITTTTTQFVPTTAESRAAMRARKLNMDRFMRLQRRPTEPTSIKTPADVVAAKGIPVAALPEVTKDASTPSKTVNEIIPSEQTEKLAEERKLAATVVAKNPASSNVEDFNHDTEAQTIVKKEEEQVARRHKS